MVNRYAVIRASRIVDGKFQREERVIDLTDKDSAWLVSDVVRFFHQKGNKTTSILVSYTNDPTFPRIDRTDPERSVSDIQVPELQGLSSIRNDEEGRDSSTDSGSVSMFKRFVRSAAGKW